MSNQTTTHHVKMTTADPSGIGLFGLAMVTLVASSQKLGLTDGVSLVLPWAIFLGGFAQIFACIHDAKHNNTFGTTAFGAYGLFWLGVGMTWLIQLEYLAKISTSCRFKTAWCSLYRIFNFHNLYDNWCNGNT